MAFDVNNRPPVRMGSSWIFDPIDSAGFPLAVEGFERLVVVGGRIYGFSTTKPGLLNKNGKPTGFHDLGNSLGNKHVTLVPAGMLANKAVQNER